MFIVYNRQSSAKVLLIHKGVCMRVGHSDDRGVGRGGGERACACSVVVGGGRLQLRMPHGRRRRHLHRRIGVREDVG